MSVPSRLALRAAARSASSPFPSFPFKGSEPLFHSGKALREDAQVSPAAIRCRGSGRGPRRRAAGRSEEHTSELQSLMRISYAVFCLKKKKQKRKIAQQNLGRRT